MSLTCRHFDPSEDQAAELGAVSGAEHPYDKHFPWSNCWSARRKAEQPQYFDDNGWSSCPCAERQSACPYYEAETPTKHRFGVIGTTAVLLDAVRLDVGVAEYRVLTWTVADSDDPVVPEGATVAFAVNSWAARNQAWAQALAAFETAVAAATGDVVVRPGPLPAPAPAVSYRGLLVGANAPCS